MLGQWLTCRLTSLAGSAPAVLGVGLGDILGLARLQLLKLKLELLDLGVIRSEERPNCIRLTWRSGT